MEDSKDVFTNIQEKRRQQGRRKKWQDTIIKA